MPQKISALPVKAKVRDAKTKYYGIPIGWEIGDKNHAGYPANSTTLVAESIIKICCFDAMESDGILDRERYGNNRYSLANIRQWLNKSGTGWYQAQHSYDRPPSNSYVWNGHNAYDAQSGFLTGFGAEMLAAMRRHAEQAGVEFLAGKVLNAVQMPDAWYVSVGPDMYNARAVVLAAGVARGKKFAGEAELLGRGVSYCATCDGMLYRGKPVAVVGYTDTARQEAEFLQKIGCSVTYFDRPKQCEIRGDGRVESVTCDGRTIPAEGVFILRPTMAPTELFPGLAVEQGYVTVDRRMATNLPGLFAAGDCTGGPLQVSKAAGDGLIAGQSAAAWAAAQERREKQS